MNPNQEQLNQLNQNNPIFEEIKAAEILFKNSYHISTCALKRYLILFSSNF